MGEEINYQEEYEKYKAMYEELLKDYKVLYDVYDNLKLKYYGTREAANYHEDDRLVRDKRDYNHWILNLDE